MAQGDPYTLQESSSSLYRTRLPPCPTGNSHVATQRLWIATTTR